MGLAALAGLPAVAGTWFGAFAFAPHLAALFLGIGAGAILQVIVEVSAYLQADFSRDQPGLLSGTSLAGFTTGLAILWRTAQTL